LFGNNDLDLIPSAASSFEGTLSLSSFSLFGFSTDFPDSHIVQEEDLHMVVSCSLSFNINVVATHALLDCGATGFAFMDETFTQTHQLPCFRLKQPRILEVIDGRPISSGNITEVAQAVLNIQGHREKVLFYLTSLGHYPIVLGIPWLRYHEQGLCWYCGNPRHMARECPNNKTRHPSTFSCSPCFHSMPSTSPALKPDDS